MSDWRSILHYDPLPPLLSSGDSAITVFAEQDLLGQTDQDVTTLWNLPEAKRIASKQLPDGSWKYPGGNPNLRSAENYDQLETFRNLGYLVEMYAFNNSSPVIVKAAGFSDEAEPAPTQAFFNLIERHFQRTVGQVVIR